MFKEITIIGGAGHVGLAFALICGLANIKVHIHDNNLDSIKLIRLAKRQAVIVEFAPHAYLNRQNQIVVNVERAILVMEKCQPVI